VSVVIADLAADVTQRGDGRRFTLADDAGRMVYLDLRRQAVWRHNMRAPLNPKSENEVAVPGVPILIWRVRETMSNSYPSRKDRLMHAAGLALAITLVSSWPLFTINLEIPGPVDFLIRLLVLPGGIVGIVAAGGNVHTPLRSVIVAANFVIYTGLVYALLGIGHRPGSVKGQK
jgi:hypothetical protein